MTGWRLMAARTGGMLVRPGPTLRAAAGDRAGFTLAFGAVLLAAPQIVLMVMGLFGRGFRGMGVDAILTSGTTGFAAGAAILIVTAALARWLARALDGSAGFGQALALMVHATVPVWVLSTIGNLVEPRQYVFGLAGLAWSIALLFVGAGAVLAVPRGKRGVFAFATGIGMLLLWAVALVGVAVVLANVLDREVAERLVRG